MKGLKTYSINYASLVDGLHEFDYIINEKFWEHFEDSFVKKSNIDLHLTMNKTVHCLELEFDVQGTVEVPCDICAEDFDYEIDSVEDVIVRIVTEIPQENNELNVVYIKDGNHSLSIAQMVYEIIILCIPMKKVHQLDENDNPTCNPKVLKYLQTSEENLAQQAKENKDKNPIWDELKKLKK